MRSLRARLGAIVGLGAMMLVLGAAVLIAIERWQEEKAGLAERVTLAAIQLAEDADPLTAPVAVSGGRDDLAAILDNPPDVLRTVGTPDEAFLAVAIDELWPDVVDQDVTISITDEDGGRRRHITASACADERACDTAVVASTEIAATDYLVARWMWIVGPALLVGLGAAALTRVVVARSLRPVDRMRAELATITSTDLDRRVSTPDSGDELERLGTAMNATLDRLGSAVTANQRFVADAAHELRSPITGVRAALELEAAKAPGGILDDGVAELDRAARLIDDLLLLARGEGGAPRRVDVDLDDLVGEQLALLVARQPDLAVTRSIAPTRVVGDPDGLRRVIANLLENAARHGGGAIDVSLDIVDGRATLAISDNGEGIPPADRARVFERFARLDEARARATGGSGLGLAIVAELVGAHGGEIEIDDAVGGGACLIVRLPTT